VPSASGEEDAEALSVERAISAAADLLTEASAYQAEHGAKNGIFF
jgi:hypothetical protein